MFMMPSLQADSNQIRILLADDHRLVRERLVARLTRETDFEIAGVASSSRAILREAEVKHPHVLLIDPLMRDGLGLATLRQVRMGFPELVIVILTAYVDTALGMQFQQMGIKHVLTKGDLASHLITQLREAYTSARLSGSQNA